MGQIQGILRSAWKIFRLDVIRAVVQQTIGKLEALTADELLRREPSRSELDVETGSVRAALETCCDELRDGCGLPIAAERPMEIQPMHATDANWTRSFSHALEAYRSAACRELDACFAVQAVPAEKPSSTPQAL